MRRSTDTRALASCSTPLFTRWEHGPGSISLEIASGPSGSYPEREELTARSSSTPTAAVASTDPTDSRDYSSGMPALRSPAKTVVSNKPRTFGDHQSPRIVPNRRYSAHGPAPAGYQP